MSRPIELPLLDAIRGVLLQARSQVQKKINYIMVQAYWQIGSLIVEQEQNGHTRAEYGKKQLELLSSRLSEEFGKGFDVSNLRRMRKFYINFPIQGTLCPELSWSHYRVLLQVDEPKARPGCRANGHVRPNV
jgi:DUF1016 N-terminal domain